MHHFATDDDADLRFLMPLVAGPVPEREDHNRLGRGPPRDLVPDEGEVAADPVRMRGC